MKMKNKGIVVFLLILAVVIVAVIIGDFLTGRPDKSKPNPFAYDVEDFKTVDPELIRYRETKNFRMGFTKPAAIDVFDGKIYVAGDDRLKTVDLSGRLLNEFRLDGIPLALDVFNDKIYIATKTRLLVYDDSGTLLKEWPSFGENTRVTALVAEEDHLFIADAGNRRVMRFSPGGDILGAFDGKSDDEMSHGFIVPSPCFDLDIDDEGELWVVNPGLHALENYTYDGVLRSYWKNTGMKPEGFSGCCNPAHFTFMQDGRFVTSEKGLVRIKIYKRSGELESVVAAPVQFADEGKAPDVAVDSRNYVYALDFDKNMIRVFEPKNSSGL